MATSPLSPPASAPRSVTPTRAQRSGATVNSSSSSSASVLSSAHNDKDIRSKLLNRLGIYDTPPSTESGGGATGTAVYNSTPMTAAQHRRLRILRGMGVGYTVSFSPPDGSAARPPVDKDQTYQEPLQGEAATTTLGKERKIGFEDHVQVIPIPTRYEYSDRIKSRIWSNRHELQENAERNAVEFASEGWNWRNVTEDDGMYICSQSGELVHPIHLRHLVPQAAAEPQQQQQQQHHAEAEGPSLERGAPVHSH